MNKSSMFECPKCGNVDLQIVNSCHVCSRCDNLMIKLTYPCQEENEN